VTTNSPTIERVPLKPIVIVVSHAGNINTNAAVNSTNDNSYTHALRSDVVATTRHVALQASDARILQMSFGKETNGGEGLREITLMKDMDVR
jgi:hypothetical protein